MATVPRLRQYYEGATTSCPRMSFGLLIRQPAPRVPAGVRVRPGALPSPYRPGDGPGSGFSCWHSLSSLFAHGQEQDLPGSLAIHPVTLRRSTTPDDPLRLANSGASGAAPTRLTMKASSLTDFEAARRFITCCLRFTTGVTARHARLASGWRATPLPGGSRTRWIATRGFSSCHPPLQGFPWRNNRTNKPSDDPHDDMDVAPSQLISRSIPGPPHRNWHARLCRPVPQTVTKGPSLFLVRLPRRRGHE